MYFFLRCVEFENEEDADKATVKMKKYEVQGRKLVVRDVSVIKGALSFRF